MPFENIVRLHMVRISVVHIKHLKCTQLKLTETTENERGPYPATDSAYRVRIAVDHVNDPCTIQNPVDRISSYDQIALRCKRSPTFAQLPRAQWTCIHIDLIDGSLTRTRLRYQRVPNGGQPCRKFHAVLVVGLYLDEELIGSSDMCRVHHKHVSNAVRWNASFYTRTHKEANMSKEIRTGVKCGVPGRGGDGMPTLLDSFGYFGCAPELHGHV